MRILRASRRIEAILERTSGPEPRFHRSWVVLFRAATTLLATAGWALASGVVCAPTALGAEPAAPARIGILSSTRNTLKTPAIAQFVQELERFGYFHGRNLTVDFRAADNVPARLSSPCQCRTAKTPLTAQQ
jgi:hypothetical protein